MAVEIRAELWMGKKLRDARGEIAGRIEEIVLEEIGGARVVKELHLGPHALYERLSAPIFDHPRGKKVRWDQLDLSDPERPRLRCPREELAPILRADED